MDPALTDLVDEARRLADRLRSLSDVRLARAHEAGRTTAGSGLAVAQLLAELGAGVEARDASSPPHRAIAPVPDFAVGDVVAVTAQDLTAAAAELSLDAEVWQPGPIRGPLRDSIAQASAACRGLRLSL